MSSIKDIISHYSAQVDAQLEAMLPAATGPAEPLFAAMRYSVFNGGKRLRPPSAVHLPGGPLKRYSVAPTYIPARANHFRQFKS